MNVPPASPRRLQDRSSMLGAWASAGLIAVAAYVCVGTSCAPENWDTAVETQVSFNAQPSVSMRLETDVSGAVREIVIRAMPAAVIDGIISVPWPLPVVSPLASGSAALTGTSLAFAAPALSSTVSTLPTASGSAALAPLVQPTLMPQTDGSFLIICGVSNCHALEFKVTPKTPNAPPSEVRVHAEIHGTTDNCGESAPSALHVELKDLTQ